mgnify:CR=1 FL=1
MTWKRCLTGSYDFVDENDDAIFQIFSFPDSAKGRISGQVFYGAKYSELIYEESLEVFTLKAAVKAKELGWNINIAKVNLSPDLSTLGRYESSIYKEYFADDKYDLIKKDGNAKFKIKKK